jgi:hypothetical protein
VVAETSTPISSLGEDEAGELYIVAYLDGKVFRLDAAASASGVVAR